MPSYYDGATQHAFEKANSTRAVFSLQLPYISPAGYPRSVAISWGDARRLCLDLTHRVIPAEDNYYVVTPVSPPQTNITYQIGENKV